MTLHQNNLRAPRPGAHIERAKPNPAHYIALAPRLGPRDRWLIRMLYEHKVLTTGQITQLAFGVERVARRRLRELYQWRVIDRFEPYLPVGRAPMHYILDVCGATILAAYLGVTVDDLGYRHDREVARAHSLRLVHTVGVNGFFTTLVQQQRDGAPGRLEDWWGETRCRQYFGDLARPDAYARWTLRDLAFEWFLEYDLGTENHQQLGRKVDDFHALAAGTAITTPVLFWFPTAAREAGARAALAQIRAELPDPGSIPVATTAGDLTEPANAPDLDRWLPLDRTGDRVDLAGLAQRWTAPARPHHPVPPPTTGRAGVVIEPPAPVPLKPDPEAWP